jgi:hypothetical protein
MMEFAILVRANRRLRVATNELGTAVRQDDPARRSSVVLAPAPDRQQSPARRDKEGRMNSVFFDWDCLMPSLIKRLMQHNLDLTAID